MGASAARAQARTKSCNRSPRPARRQSLASPPPADARRWHASRGFVLALSRPKRPAPPGGRGQVRAGHAMLLVRNPWALSQERAPWHWPSAGCLSSGACAASCGGSTRKTMDGRASGLASERQGWPASDCESRHRRITMATEQIASGWRCGASGPPQNHSTFCPCWCHTQTPQTSRGGQPGWPVVGARFVLSSFQRRIVSLRSATLSKLRYCSNFTFPCSNLCCVTHTIHRADIAGWANPL